MESKREKTESTPAAAAAAAAAISMVLGDDDLLGEILLRVALPASLVRASLVCRRWFRAASDPGFLRRFRGLHPPRLLGFYLTTWANNREWLVDFVPTLPQPPELAAVLRRTSFGLGAYGCQATRVMDCRNGSVVASLSSEDLSLHGARRPLHPAKGTVLFPPPPVVSRQDGELGVFSEILSKEDGDGRLSYFWFSLHYTSREQKATARAYILQDDAWHTQSSATTQISTVQGSTLSTLSTFLADDKIYMGITVHNILVLDLKSSTFSTINYLDRVALDGEIRLSRASGSGFYLVHVNELKLCIWHYKGDNGAMGDWSLVDTICLHDMCAKLRVLNSTAEDGHTADVYIHEVGESVEFVFLEMNACVLHLDVRSRELKKVHDLTGKDTRVCFIHPFMMVWPPNFPVLME